VRLRVYGRRYCHLCDEMIVALRALQSELTFQFEVLDVDSDAALEARYGELVPVLVDAHDAEICHYWLDEDALRKRLALK
jgi:hypothetical protein